MVIDSRFCICDNIFDELWNKAGTGMEDLLKQILVEVQGVKSELSATRAELKADIEAARTELYEEIDAARMELKGEIKAIRADLKADIATLDDKVDKYAYVQQQDVKRMLELIYDVMATKEDLRRLEAVFYALNNRILSQEAELQLIKRAQ